MSLKKQVIVGSFWTVGGSMGFMFVSLLTTVVLSRMLTPFEFGQMGILMFFINIAAIFIESGFGGALVRLGTITDDDYSTTFVFNLLISVACFLLIALFSGVIANFYHDAALRNLLIVAGSIFFVNAFNVTQNSKLIRELRFKKKYIVQTIAVTLAGIVSIICAYEKMGVWSLVIFQVSSSAFNTLILYLTGEGTHFSFRFSKASFRQLYSFGVNTTLTSLLATVFDNIYQMILGRSFSLQQGGLYTQAKKLQTVPFAVLNSIVLGVIFSSLSKLQDDKEKFIIAYNRLMLAITIVMSLITALIYLYADSLILILFTSKWAGAIFYMQLLCVASFFYFQELFNNVIFKVFNQTKKILYLEIVKKLVQIIGIIVGVIYMDISILLYCFIASSIFSYGINFYYSRKILGDKAWFEIISIGKVVAVSVFCVLVSRLAFVRFHINFKVSLIFMPVFVLLFVGLLRIFKIFNVVTEMKMIKGVIKSR